MLAKGLSHLLLYWLQKAVGQSGVDKPEVQPCNQHNKHAQEKAVPKFRVKWFELLAMNKNLVADNKTLQTENHELSQSLHDQRALNAKMHEELQCLQNNLNMQRAALASKDKQLLQVLYCTTTAVFHCLPFVRKTLHTGAIAKCNFAACHCAESSS